MTSIFSTKPIPFQDLSNIKVDNSNKRKLDSDKVDKFKENISSPIKTRSMLIAKRRERRISLTPHELTKILEKDPFERKDSLLLSPSKTKKAELFSEVNKHTPNKVHKAADVRVRHVEKSGVTDSPMSKTAKEEYGEGPLSKRAKKFKKDNDISVGRNVSLIIFYDAIVNESRYVIAATDGPPGGPHAELRAIDALPSHVSKENIQLIYTEREPCRHGSQCYCKLKMMIEKTTKVVWSIDFPDIKETRQVSEEEFRKLQAAHGIRLPGTKPKS